MPIIHYLNVQHGDCSIITHRSEKVTVIDVSNAKKETEETKLFEKLNTLCAVLEKDSRQLQSKTISSKSNLLFEEAWDYVGVSVHRFTSRMDHLDGLEASLETFSP